MKNKGFAISGILYTILLIFLAIVSMLLMNLKNKKYLLDRIKDDTLCDGKAGQVFTYNNVGENHFETPCEGYYKIELWGAQGGNATYSSEYTGGLGSYTSGIIKLDMKQGLYIYVGGAGGTATTTAQGSAGANGGGSGTIASGTSTGGGGGGATDVRITSGNDFNALKSRIMVAAGGGGAKSHSNESNSSNGGSGLGLGSTSSTFGQGSSNSSGGAGGGGGYYGGTSGLGGTSYISGHKGSNSIAQSSTSSNITLTGEATHYSGLYFINTRMIDGEGYGWTNERTTYVTAMPSHDGSDRIIGNSGNGYAKITYLGKKEVAQEPEFPACNVNINQKYTFSSTGSVQEFTVPCTGRYKLEVWGAQGGSYDTTYVGGKGGYSKGTITLSANTKLYVQVGGAGSKLTTSSTLDGGGYNGGGNAYTTNSSYLTTGGGGATDIRINENTLNARVIVAGGGGGAFGGIAAYGNGGVGGGVTGGVGIGSSTYMPGTGGTSTAPGSSYYGTTLDSTSYGTPAAFGVGGSALSSSYTNGGGGGWYGGGYARRAGAGGGSGYVYTSSTAADYPSSGSLSSDYYLSDAETIAGDQEMPTHNGNSTMTGNEDTGYAKITYVGNGIYPEYVINNACLDSVWNFEYNGTNGTDGTVQEFTVPCRGKYQLEVWGAQGGNYYNANYSGNTPGLGGYSIGEINLNSSDKLYIYVGGSGGNATSTAQGSPGFNGGGTIPGSKAGRDAGAGGGASDIRVNSDSLYARVIVAGGGGGASPTNNTTVRQLGGAGGGTTGQTGLYSSYSSSYTCDGGGGTQTSGGAASSYSNSDTTVATAGTFGVGGSGAVKSGTWSCASGGGGWYGGGGANYTGGGGGGSGYVYTSLTAANYPSGCLLTSAYYLTNATTTAGTETFIAPDGTEETGHSGNGYVRITYIGS